MMPHIMKPFALDTTFIVHDAYFNIIFMHSSFCGYNFHIYSFVETFIFGMQAVCGLQITLLFSFLNFNSNG